MRLLRIEGKDTFSLVDVFDTHETPYAILSHTWGPDGTEVSHEDLVEGTGPIKAGYRKILACAEKTLRYGLTHFWVDTCCIDKTSSAELSEAINSMYHWYQEATICFAYLEDASPHSPIPQHSRWFTRGWTLQELLAPRNIIFFAEDWSCLGTKTDCSTQLSTITGIDGHAFGSKPIRFFSIAQRMSWAAKRVTTRPEDIAYCLLGIFDVNMPLLYGEGLTAAFVRLQEEIMKDSNDQSLFAWCRPHITNSSSIWHIHDGSWEPCSLLAESPADFESSGSFVPIVNKDTLNPYSMTNAGLRITLQMTQIRESYHVAILDCVDLGASGPTSARSSQNDLVVLVLQSLTDSGDRYGRVSIRSLNYDKSVGNLRSSSKASLRELHCSSRTIYVPENYHREFNDDRFGKPWARSHPRVYGSEASVVSTK